MVRPSSLALKSQESSVPVLVSSWLQMSVVDHSEYRFMHSEAWPYLKPYSLSIPTAKARVITVSRVGEGEITCGGEKRGISMSPA